MANTKTGDGLTGWYRADQVATRARALQQVTRLWSDVRVDDLPGTIGAFAAAAAEVVLAFAGTAGEDTADYLEAFRGAEHRGGPAYRFVPAPLPTAAEVADLIRGAALTGIVNSRRRGGDSRRALANGLVKTLGQAGKSVMDAGRETVVAGAKGDPAAVGWVRVLSPGACDFCQTLATRPPSRPCPRRRRRPRARGRSRSVSPPPSPGGKASRPPCSGWAGNRARMRSPARCRRR